jgi:serine protease SohB
MTEEKNRNLNLTIDKKSNFWLFFFIFLGLFIAVFYYNYENRPIQNDLVVKNYGSKYSKLQRSFPGYQDYSGAVTGIDYNKTAFYLEFTGDMFASQVESLRQEIDGLLMVAQENSLVVVKITSPGGGVSEYGLVAAQLERVKKYNLKLVVLVDTVAASGGYMAAAVADEIVAAPFAMVGSIGVVAQIPIFEELLKNVGVEYKVYTAGESKRTVTSFSQPSKEEEEKFKIELSKIHDQFKSHVKKYREDIDIDKVSTGGFFLGEEALEIGLIDTISTSDEYLRELYLNRYSILSVKYVEPKSFQQKLSDFTSNTLLKVFNDLNQKRINLI